LIDTWEELESFGILFVSSGERVARRLLQKPDRCSCACFTALRARSGSYFNMLLEDIGDTVLSEEHVTKTGYDKSMIYQARPNIPETKSLLSCDTRILLVNLIKLAVKESGGR
jgi:hypothetical protein